MGRASRPSLEFGHSKHRPGLLASGNLQTPEDGRDARPTLSPRRQYAPAFFQRNMVY